ncbi:hypothetical protein EfmAA96_31640 (plasmid) [Enterococcus faecium]|nr:hypothetical protein EfmAA96_31640 [Enterococcus faecium]
MSFWEIPQYRSIFQNLYRTFCDLLQEKGKGRFKQPEKIAKAIQRAITMSYRLGALAQESINVVLHSYEKQFLNSMTATTLIK